MCSGILTVTVTRSLSPLPAFMASRHIGIIVESYRHQSDSSISLNASGWFFFVVRPALPERALVNQATVIPDSGSSASIPRAFGGKAAPAGRPYPIQYPCFHDLTNQPRVTSLNNLQLRLHRRIQQINRLLEPLILNKCGICLFCSLDRSMAQQMLNIRNSSTPTQ